MEVVAVSDFDRLLGDSLKAIRDDHVREIEAEIPAARQRIASKVRTRRLTFVIGGVAVAAAAVAVALFIAQSVPNLDRTDPIPPSVTPPSETAEEETAEDMLCSTFLPFLSSDGALSLGLGSGGQVGVPLAQQTPRALVHYADEPGRFVDVIAGETVWPPFDEESIKFLGTEGTLHRIEDGYAVTFAAGGCDFQLAAYGYDKGAVRAFVGTLVLRGHAETSYDGFALWPETKPEQAYESCLRTQRGQTSQAESGGTAATFAIEVLGWKEVVVRANNEYRNEEGEASFDVRRDDLAESAPRVTITVREVALDCWAVIGVTTPAPPYEPTSLSVSKRGARLRVGFDLDVRGLEEAATIRIPAEYGSVSMTVEDFRKQGIEGVFRSLSDGGPGAFLVLIEDRSGQVIGAIGMALPSGDFTAG